MIEPRKISFLLAGVDGTLLTREKILTEPARNAVHSLHAAGIHFAIMSGQPPKGMVMSIEPLALNTPIAGFNGGVFVHPGLTKAVERFVLSAPPAAGVAP